MRRQVAALALALVLVTAGCNGLGAGGDGDDRIETRTVTPVAVPNETASRLAPGLSEEGVVDAEALLDAHTDLLAERPYRRVARTALVFDDGTERVLRNETRLYHPAGRAFLSVFERDDRPNVPTTDFDVWTNGSVTLDRTNVTDAHVEYDRRAGETILHDHGGARAVRTLANQPASVVDERVRNGTLEYVLVGETGPEVGPGTAGRIVGVVTDSGLLRSLVFESRLAVDGRAATFRIELRYEPYAGTVPRPAWIDEALDGRANATDRRT